MDQRVRGVAGRGASAADPAEGRGRAAQRRVAERGRFDDGRIALRELQTGRTGDRDTGQEHGIALSELRRVGVELEDVPQCVEQRVRRLGRERRRHADAVTRGTQGLPGAIQAIGGVAQPAVRVPERAQLPELAPDARAALAEKPFARLDHPAGGLEVPDGLLQGPLHPPERLPP